MVRINFPLGNHVAVLATDVEWMAWIIHANGIHLRNQANPSHLLFSQTATELQIALQRWREGYCIPVIEQARTTIRQKDARGKFEVCCDGEVVQAFTHLIEAEKFALKFDDLTAGVVICEKSAAR